MKIIINNYKKPDKPTQIVCGHCNSVLEVTKKDLQVYNPNPDDRFDEYYSFIKCACCGVNIKNPNL